MEMARWVRRLKNWYHWVRGWFWVVYYGYPAGKMTVVGVTGTDGKTTTATLIYEMLKTAGRKCGLVSTVAARIGEKTADMALHVTNPDPRVLQGLLRKMAEAGCTHAVLEVTSHGLDQNRVVGCNFYMGVLTNISHEHLDYHGTMEEYVAAKAKLFRKVKYAILNRDERRAKSIASLAGGKVVWYGPAKKLDISPGLGGEYNKYNIGAAEAAAQILEAGEAVMHVVRGFRGVPGRREEVKMGQKFRAVVDFAHTPNALEQLLKSLREELPRGKRLIAIFGCTGERDKDKRPVMGEAAGRLADVVIITTDDVRNDSIDDIYSDIVKGIKDMKKVRREDDRDKAIETGVKMARPGDIVVAAGMGHETTQLIGKVEKRRSDRGAFEKAIRGLLK